jgi:alkylhydroperoxidase family enzyme
VRVKLLSKQHLLRLAAPLVLLLVFASGVTLGRAPQGQARVQPASSVSKSGIPYRPAEDAGPRALVDAIRARRPGGTLLNLDRMLLHSPPFAQGWNGMFAAIRGQLALSPKLRELAVMSIGVLNRADYEWVQHEKEFIAAGGTSEQMDALRNPAAALTDSRFDEVEQATLALTYEMTRDVVVTDATMRRVRALLPDQQVVELVGTIAGYNMVSRFLVATGIELE